MYKKGCSYEQQRNYIEAIKWYKKVADTRYASSASRVVELQNLIQKQEVASKKENLQENARNFISPW